MGGAMGGAIKKPPSLAVCVYMPISSGINLKA